jgi:hypothetical protein
MTVRARTKSTISWLILLLVAYVGIGACIFPDWWKAFLFKGQIANPAYWREGINYVARYVLFQHDIIYSILITVASTLIALGLYFHAFHLKLPELNILRPPFALLLILFGMVIALAIYFVPTQTEGILSTLSPASLSEFTLNSLLQTDTLNPPVDFYFIDEVHISSLYDQIAPPLILDRTTTDKESQGTRELSGGAKIVEGKRQEASTQKQSEEYRAREVSLSKKGIDVYNYYVKSKELGKYETLELSSDELKALDQFIATGKAFGIRYDTVQYESASNRIIGNVVKEQLSKLKSLRGHILVKGECLFTCSTDFLTLSHDYFNKGPAGKITFLVASIGRSSTSIKSEAWRQPPAKTTMSVFGKVIDVLEQKDNGLTIRVEPYLIW